MFRKLIDNFNVVKRKKFRLGLILATRDLPGYNFFDPLGLGYLKSYGAREITGVDIDIYKDLRTLIQSRPDCIGISASTQDFPVAQQYIKNIREELGCPTLLGGVHISLLPETLPKGAIGCIGEGEETLVELINILLQCHTFDPTEVSKVKGIAYWDENSRFVQTAPRELIIPLDRIPFPDRDALGITPRRNDTLYMFTSRGCPYNCKFCVSRVHWKKYREFSSDYVLREIEQLITKYAPSSIHFFDDLFIVNRKRLREIAEKFEKKNYPITTSCAVRANLVDDELCELLKRLNVREVMFGAESFSEEVLKELKSGSVSAAMNQCALDTLHKHDIKTNVSIIFDAPEETREDMTVTWRALFNNLRAGKINKVGYGFLIPYPGSFYWDMAVRKGLCQIDMDWERFGTSVHFHMNENMKKEDVYATVGEWATKCYLVNIHFRDEPTPKYSNKFDIFVKEQALIERICERQLKDETDTFVAQEYEQFSKGFADQQLVLSEGWEAASGQSYRWIVGKCATFFLNPSVKKDANLLNMIFFVPNIQYYPNNKLNVTLEIENCQSNVIVLSTGEHMITITIPSASSGPFLHCRIICSSDFCPAKVTNSEDPRNLSIVVSRFELAKDKATDVVNIIRLPRY